MRPEFIVVDGKLKACTFRGPFSIKKKPAIEHLLHKNHKTGPCNKGFNVNTNTPNTVPTQDTIDHHKPKANSVHF